MNPALVLRADAGHGTGSGHVMRLAALAEAAVARGGRARIVVGGEPAASLSGLLARGLDAVGCAAVTGSDGDREQVLAAARGLGAAIVVVDGPRFTAEFTGELAASGLIVASVDDLATAPLPTSIVINHNLGAERLAARYPAAAVRLLGRRFHLLRDEFRALPAGGTPLRTIAGRVLVTMGGSDPVGATARVVAAMPGSGLQVVVVLGPDFRCDDCLAAALASADAHGHTVELRYRPTDLAAIMSDCDLAVSAGGGTLAELAYLGRPTVALAIVADQVANASRHAELGLVAGGRPITSYLDDELARVIGDLLGDPVRRRDLRARALAAVDGQGAVRVLDQLGFR